MKKKNSHLPEFLLGLVGVVLIGTALYHILSDYLAQRILSNRHIDLSDFSSAALSSIAVATATPHSSALHMKKSSCVNIADT